jgi:O-antigen/teichoic acid export membrane protein
MPYGIPTLIKDWLRDGSDQSIAQRMAGTTFVIRVTNAAIVYLTQVFLARWMGGFEFGIYVYVWTWVLLAGDLVHFGLPLAAQRYIPEYIKFAELQLLRGFLVGGQWLVFSLAAAAAIFSAVGIKVAEPWLGRYEIIPLYLACVTLPFYALSSMLDGIARSYNWVNVALIPPYFVRPLILIALMAVGHAAGFGSDAVTAMVAAVVATWISTIVQLAILNQRLTTAVERGPKAYAVKAWLGTSLPIIMAWGFYVMLTYTDVLVLQQFRPPKEVGIYYAASKTLALVAFVYFSVATAVAHRFSEYHVAGNQDGLRDFVTKSVKWTFWPSLAATVVILGLGKPLLRLFGPEFIQGYPLMFILAIGLMARASIGPAERLLNMLGEQRSCAMVYATAFATNVVACVVLIPRFGITGAAIATSAALMVESTLLFAVSKRRLGLHIFIWRGRAGGGYVVAQKQSPPAATSTIEVWRV